MAGRSRAPGQTAAGDGRCPSAGGGAGPTLLSALLGFHDKTQGESFSLKVRLSGHCVIKRDVI